ncbi:MAG: putative alpha/beta superfamily hydrolase [Patescibacteria group bacterium]|jgi:predicted alpha/beta superfamily hydrolase
MDSLIIKKKSFKMKNLFILLLLSISQISFAQEADTVKTTPFIIGESFSFHSEVLKESRMLNIYLPPAFHPDSAQRYPVIYLLDGSADEDFIHIAGLVNFLNFPWARTMPDAIIVGISNIDRKRDFTYPTTVKKDKKDFPTTGGSEAFIQFLEKELKPLIEKRYPTNGVSTLLGQSLGGLLATEVLFKKSDLFTNYIIVSPSLWWDKESLLDYDLKTVNAKSVYVGVGKEGEVMERVAKELAQKLEKINNTNTAVYFDFLEEEDHTNVLHRAAYNGFRRINGSRSADEK